MSSVKDLLRGDVVDGSGTANYVTKWSDANTLTDSAISDNGTTVVIQRSLDVKDAAATTSGIEIRGNSDVPRIDFLENGNYRLSIGYRGDDAPSGGQNLGEINVYANAPLLFRTNNTERMRIDASGNVGIGKSSLVDKINLYQATGSYGILFQNAATGTTATDGSRVFLNEATNGLTLLVNESVPMTFGTLGMERMRITNVGNVLFNNTTTGHIDNANNVSILSTLGRVNIGSNSTASSVRMYFTNPNGAVGNILTSASSTAYNTASDYRLKENVVAMEGALERVSQLQPSRFNFIADPEKTVDGFLAHQVQEVVPEAISGEKDAVDEEGKPVYQGIDQSKLVPLLVGAIQELKAEIETLKAQINN